MNTPNRLVVAWIVGVAALAAVGGLAFWVVPAWFAARPTELTLHGVVEQQEVRLGSKVGGRVAEILVGEGGEVYAGRPLVRLALPELEAQRDRLQAQHAAAVAERDKAEAGPRDEEKAEARAAVAAAEARLALAKKRWRDEEVAQARHDLDVAEADLRVSGQELARAQSLAGTGGVTASDLDQARAAYRRGVGRASAARVRLDMVVKGGRPEEIEEAAAERDRLKARADLLAAGTRPEDKRIAQAQVEQIEAQLKEVAAQLAEGVVAAEEPCRIEVIAVRKGDLVAPNQPMMRVLRAEDLWVRIYIPEPDLAKVRVGQAVRATLDAYPGVEFTGQVVQITGVSEFTPRNVQSPEQRKHQVFAAKVHIDDPKGIFKSGLAAKVVLPLHGTE